MSHVNELPRTRKPRYALLVIFKSGQSHTTRFDAVSPTDAIAIFDAKMANVMHAVEGAARVTKSAVLKDVYDKVVLTRWENES